MPSSRIPSPARSQGVISTPRRHKHKTRRSHSVCSLTPKNMSIRLSALVTDSYKVSPLPNRQSILTDETDKEIQPGRKSWWKRLGETSIEVMDVPDSRDEVEIKNVADEFDVEVLSQEKRNYTLDLPESSDGESISSIVIPQRKLFTQKENNPQKKFAQINNNRDSQNHKSHIDVVKDIEIAPKNLCNQPKQRNKPVFPSGLLNISVNKTLNKTKEMPAPAVKSQVRSLFGNRPATKRKNMFADFIVSDSEDDIPDIQPKVFAFKKNVEEKRKQSTSSRAQHHSPASSIDLEMDEWKLLPSSTMMGNQLEDTTPVKRARLSKLSEMKELESASEINKTEQSNKSVKPKNKSIISSNSKLKEVETLQQQDVVIEAEPNFSSSRLTRNRSKSIRETSLIKANHSKISNMSKNIKIGNKDVANKTAVNENYENVEQNTSVGDDGNKIEDNDNEDFTLEYENDDDIIKDADSSIGNQPISASFHKSKNKNETVSQLKNKSNINEDKQKTQETLNTTNNKNKSINKSYKKHEINEDTIHEFTEIVSNNQKVQNVNVEKQSIISNIEFTEKVIDSVNISQHNKNNRLNTTTNKENQILNIENKIINETKTKIISHKNENIEESENENQDKDDKSNDQMEVGENEEDDESENENETENPDIQNESEEHSEQIESEQDKEDMDVDEENESKEENVLNEIRDENDGKNFHKEQKNEVSENQLNDSEKESDREMTNEEHQKEVSKDEETCDNEEEKNESIYEEREHHIVGQKDCEIEQNEDDEQIEDDDQNKERNGSQNETNDAEDDAAVNENNESPNIMNEKRENLEGITSPEAILHDKTNQINSFTAQGRNTTARKTKSILIKTLNIRPSLAPVRESTRFSDGTRDSSADNSGWDSHRTTRKTLRQTFGKDFTLRKSLRTLVMEKSAKRNTNYMDKADVTEVDNLKVPQANSTEFPHFDSYEEEPMHIDETPGEVSKESKEPVKLQDLKEHKGIEEYEQHEKSEQHEITEEHKKNEETEEYEETEENEETEEYEETEENEETEEHEESEQHEESKHEESEQDAVGQEHEETEEHVATDEHIETEEHVESEELEDSEEFEDRQEYEKHEETEEHENQEYHDESEEHEESEEIDDREEHEELQELEEHEASKRTRQTTLELYLQKIKEENLKKKRIMQEQVRNSIKTTQQYNPFKVPKKPVPRIKTIDKSKKNEKNKILLSLPAEVIEDMKYKPPKRFQPNNASWITKRLYKFLETKLEPKYDYKARVRAEKLVETIYNFTKDIKKQNVAPSQSIDVLKNEMARLDIVKTHFDFYEFFNNYMPREIRIKVIPDVVNKISVPKHGVFAEIIR